MEYINAAPSGKAGKVLAVRKLDSGNIVITADSHETKNLIEHEEGWTNVIAGKTKVKGPRFRVMVHTMRTNRIETANQEKALAELQAQNPQLKEKVKFLMMTWKQETLRVGKLHGPLLIDVGTPEEANTLVLEGLLHDHELKNCELFHSECIMTQCFKCYQYGHIAMTCQRPQTCGNCAKEHLSATCQTAKDPRTYFCSNCKSKHQAWDRACPVRKAEAEQAATAYATLTTLYTVTSNASPAA